MPLRAPAPLRRKVLALAAPVVLLALSACATPFRADVARFQRMPAPQGQSFVIQAADPRNRGGIEFQQYASVISQAMVANGYQPAADPRRATLVVNVGYGVDNGNEKVVTTPGYGGFGYGRFGRPYYSRFGGFGGYGFGYGWNDPYFFGSEVNSYTYFTSFLDMTIDRTADGVRLFEGKAKARSRTDSLPVLVPNLVEALFTGFPGRSGEEVRITVAPPPRS